MHLSFLKPHLSIEQFPSIEVPNFVLLTGENGAGKTHLMYAILNGAISCDLASNPDITKHTEIRYLTHSSIYSGSNQEFNSDQYNWKRRSETAALIKSLRSPELLRPFGDLAQRFEELTEFVGDAPRLAMITEDVFTSTISGDRAQIIWQAVIAARETVDKLLINVNRHYVPRINIIKQHYGRHFCSLSDNEITSSLVPDWGEVDLFAQSLRQLFAMYRDLKLANDFARFRSQEGETVFYHDHDSFLRIYGPPPWDFVNSTFESAGLDFCINAPGLNDHITYEPYLTKISTGRKIELNQLSSGEKVLVSFAFIVYYSHDTRQISVKPKLLLLDEVDAPLHPSMTKHLLKTLIDVLVKDMNIAVIACTHSPSTVALAPEESVYVMLQKQPGIIKTSKSVALNILTEGVPTLSLNFTGQRQVIVESPSDAAIYDSLYRAIRTRLGSERSLSFLSTGFRNEANVDINTGCYLVNKIVKELSTSGNKSVFGIVDWDGTNESSDRVFVSAQGVRNGLENLVFDPLAMVLLIAREKSLARLRPIIGLSDEKSYIVLLGSNKEFLQSTTDRFTSLIFQNAQKDCTVDYAGGLSLISSKAYLREDDHYLEEKLYNVIPELKSLSRNRSGALMQHVVETIFVDAPQFIPKEITDLMLKLLNAPAH